MKIFFLGGTFDPPHIGHLNIALRCLDLCDKFIFIPTKKNPHKDKTPYFSCNERIEMLKIMIPKYKNIELDLFEINSNQDINYSIDTINYLKNKYNNDSLSMVVGSDLIDTLDQWKEWNKIEKMVNIVCVNRLNYSCAKLINKKYPEMLFLEDFDVNVSSSLLREYLLSDSMDDISNHSMIHNSVFNYICNIKRKKYAGI